MPTAAHVAASTSSLRTLFYRLVHTMGRPKKAAKTLGSEDQESAEFSAHPIWAEVLQVSRAVAMCEDFARILAMVQPHRDIDLKRFFESRHGEFPFG